METLSHQILFYTLGEMINVNQLTIEQNIVKDQCDAWHGKIVCK